MRLLMLEGDFGDEEIHRSYLTGGGFSVGDPVGNTEYGIRSWVVVKWYGVSGEGVVVVVVVCQCGLCKKKRRSVGP